MSDASTLDVSCQHEHILVVVSDTGAIVSAVIVSIIIGVISI